MGFVVAFLCGSVSTFAFMVCVLSYAHKLAYPNWKSFVLRLMFEIGLFFTRLRRKTNSYRLSPVTSAYNLGFGDNITVDKENMDKFYELYPYARILPQTHPSNEYILLDETLMNRKQKLVKKMNKKGYKMASPLKFRKQVEDFCANGLFAELYADNTQIDIEYIEDVECHWISFNGSSTANGIIICIHGGAYVSGSPEMQYALCSLLSKLTGMVCISVHYCLCPEFPIPLAVNDIITVYRYLLNERNISPDKISVMGESAGGGLALLFLQKLNDILNGTQMNMNDVPLPLPAACWISSPWTDQTSSGSSRVRNAEYDSLLIKCSVSRFSDLVVGNISLDGEVIAENDLKSAEYSPLYGNWKGLCPLYFMCGGSEMLLDDSLNASRAAYEAGVDVRLDIEPNMMHTWILFGRVFYEAHYTIVRAADFILSHVSYKRK